MFLEEEPQVPRLGKLGVAGSKQPLFFFEKKRPWGSKENLEIRVRKKAANVPSGPL